MPGETLESISKNIKLENPVYLKEYHNSHCTAFDFIHENLVSGKKLLIPNLTKIQFYNSKNDAPSKLAEQNPVISFKPENLNVKYKISVAQSSEVDGKKTDSEFSYVVELIWKEKIGNSHHFSFTKTEIKDRSQTKMSTIATACIESLNPLEIVVSEEGVLLDVRLSEKIRENFSDKKTFLEDQFPDQYSKIYLDKFEWNVLNPENFKDKMKTDWFLKTYFAPFRRKFTNGISKYHIVLQDEPVNIIQKGFQNENIIIHAEMADPIPELNYMAEYQLNSETGIIENYHFKMLSEEFGTSYSTDFKAQMKL